MIKKSLPLIALLSLAVATPAQTFNEYLAARKKNGITQATSPAALETFVGERVLEVRGVIRGFMESSSGQLLVLENPDSHRELFISAKDAPSWLKTSNTTARLLIKASRDQENAPVDSMLIMATAEGPIASYENQLIEAARKKAEEEAKRAEAKARNSTPASRGGNQIRLPGRIPKISQSPLQDGPQLSAEFLALVGPYTDFIQKRNRKLSVSKAQNIAETILAYSAHYGVDPRLIMALVVCESNFDPNSTSHAGARGLGQLMPGTAKGLGVSNSYDTEQNLYGTIKLLRGHLDKYTNKTGDSFEGLVLALAAYNAGPGAVSKHGGVPPYRETQNYVRKVIAMYKQLCGE
ncbi:MAG: lytic transglycosylase domain-containing protein [Fimbriimonadaceae bacterium]